MRRTDGPRWQRRVTCTPAPRPVLGGVQFRVVGCSRTKRPELAEWAARANRGLPMVNFEVDLDQGGVWFTTSIDVEDELWNALLENLIAANFITTDRYLGTLRRWLDGEMSPTCHR
jgi:Putative bacterial sensory transduction regulator